MRISGIWPGILFCFFAATYGAMAQWPLAIELFVEGDWTNCHRECLRLLAEDPKFMPARVLAEVTQLIGLQLATLDAGLESEVAQLGDNDLQARALYELGRFYWNRGDVSRAGVYWERSFLTARDPGVSAHVGCTLYQVIMRSGERLTVSPSVRLQLQTLADSWDRDVWQAAALPVVSDGGWGARPGAWIVSFYRRQIAPAIGTRCSLSPSCSEYFRQASHRYGLLAFPIMADRLVREPSVIQEQAHPIVSRDRMRFRDEVGWHTYWWAKDGEEP